MKGVNILSIDMDYIMEPSINKYNNYIKSDIKPSKLWKNVYKRIGKKRNKLRYNQDKLEELVKLLNMKCELTPIDNIVYVDDHDGIVDFMVDKGIIFKDGSGLKTEIGDINIFNIDHHHDIYYSENQAVNVDTEDNYSVGSWMWLLDKYSLISNYTWIRNHNSSPYYGMPTNCNYYEVDTLSYLLNVNFDYIFICKSPHWIPPEYHDLIDIIIYNYIY